MRTAILVWISFLSFAAQAIADERQVFQFGNGENTGALIHDYANRWVEYGAGTERFGFVETSRTDKVIELLDRGRDVGLRVYADHGELRLPGSKDWGPWAQGKWTKREELPGSIKFVPADQKIRLAYFLPRDRQPISDYARRIRVVMQFANHVFHEDLRAKGIRTDGFSFQTDADGEPVVHLIQTSKDAQQYNGGPNFNDIQHFQRIAADIPAEIGSGRRHLIVVLAETYDPGPAPIEWNGSVGRGGSITTDGGLAVMSSWILQDEFCGTSFEEQRKLILDGTPIPGRTALGTRKPNSPRFEFIEDGWGAVIHEVGHALGLPHDYRTPNDIMGHGFRSLQVNFKPGQDKQKLITFSRENSRLLGVSRYLAKNVDLNDNTGPTGEFSIRITAGSSPAAIVALKAADDQALRAVVILDVEHDTVIGGAELKGRSQEVNTRFPLKGTFKPGEYKFAALVADGGGNITRLNAAAKMP